MAFPPTLSTGLFPLRRLAALLRLGGCRGPFRLCAFGKEFLASAVAMASASAASAAALSPLAGIAVAGCRGARKR